MSQNEPKWFQMVLGGTKWCQVVPGGAMPGDPRCLKITKMVPDGDRWYQVGSGGIRWCQVVLGDVRWY